MRGLGVKQVLSWILLAAVVLAVFQAYNGDVGKMTTGLVNLVQSLADVMTDLWHQVKT
ncbi:hypothetical protein [Tessaracoccus sp.]